MSLGAHSEDLDDVLFALSTLQSSMSRRFQQHVLGSGISRVWSAATESHSETLLLGTNANLQEVERNPGMTEAPVVSRFPKIEQKTIPVSW